jgi:hypothetical protein
LISVAVVDTVAVLVRPVAADLAGSRADHRIEIVAVAFGAHSVSVDVRRTEVGEVAVLVEPVAADFAKLGPDELVPVVEIDRLGNAVTVDVVPTAGPSGLYDHIGRRFFDKHVVPDPAVLQSRPPSTNLALASTSDNQDHRHRRSQSLSSHH